MSVQGINDLRQIITNLGSIPATPEAINAVEKLCKVPGAIHALLGMGQLTTGGGKIRL